MFAHTSPETLTGSVVDAVHVVVDRSLVTGQNDNSTALAVQNFVWLCQRSTAQ
jgi:hypothetical protein